MTSKSSALWRARAGRSPPPAPRRTRPCGRARRRSGTTHRRSRLPGPRSSGLPPRGRWECRCAGVGDRLQGLAEPLAARERQRVVGTGVGDRRLTGEYGAHHRHVLARAGQGLRKGLAVPPFDDLGSRHAEAEHEAPAAQMVEGERRHGHGGGRARRQLAQGSAEAHPLGLRSPPRQRCEGVGPVRLRRPHRVVPEALGLGHQLVGVGGRARAPVPHLQAQLELSHHVLLATTMSGVPVLASWP